MSSSNKRRETDMMKLIMHDYKVETIDDAVQEFYVQFKGPADSPYHGGVWKVKVELPEDYPYKSPSIGFVNKIFHPNIDEASGSVCLDVINQSWSPMFDLVNVFEAFLPQLLLYPNPSDPLNKDAAALLMRDEPTYEARVKEYCERYAKPEDARIGDEAKSSEEELTGDERDSGDEAKASESGDERDSGDEAKERDSGDEAKASVSGDKHDSGDEAKASVSGDERDSGDEAKASVSGDERDSGDEAKASGSGDA